MPDESGKLTQEEKERIASKLNTVAEGKMRNCPICSDSAWVIADHLVQPIVVGKDGAVMLGGVGYPQVMLVSTKCGYTRFVNAVALGIVAGTPQSKG